MAGKRGRVEYGSGAYDELAQVFDADADVLAANLGWE